MGSVEGAGDKKQEAKPHVQRRRLGRVYEGRVLLLSVETEIRDAEGGYRPGILGAWGRLSTTVAG